MTIEEIIRGESKTVEFKEMLPQNSEKYTRTIVAFANTQGGKIIFGVVDETREIVGIDSDILFEVMDSIANAVSDSCVPQIVPDIEPYTINGKTIIIVTVHPEPHRPYYLKSKGKENGTYIRVGATTRLACPEKIKDLEFEGANISWDELTCVGFTVKDAAIKTLCRDMNRYRKEMQSRKGLVRQLPAVTRTNLENWHLLKKNDDSYLASNAFALLTSAHFPFSKTQCAVFKGTTRSVFLDKREFDGPIYRQIEEAEAFVLRNIRLGAKIDGLIRKEAYELPLDAIREMIVNAHCHRNFRDESCVQVAIFDDRLEVSSPGGLYNGLTFEDALRGRSRLRNRVIANIFSQMGLIEAWGTGLQRIRDAAHEYGLPDPEFIEMSDGFRVNLYRRITHINKQTCECDVGENVGENVGDVGENVGDVGENVGDVGENVGDVGENVGDVGENVGDVGENVGDVGTMILNCISNNNRVSATEIATKLSITPRTVERYIKLLREDGTIVRHGGARGGYWEIMKY